MKRLLPIIIAILLACCSGGSGRYPSISKWPSEGREADSLTDLVERAFVYGLSPDSLQTLLHELDHASRDRGKVDFFRARHFRQKQMPDSSKRILFLLKNTIDSQRSPYLWMRLKVAETRHISNAGQKFRFISDALDYFRHVKDTFMMANELIDLSNIMLNTKDYANGLAYLNEAQALYLKLGLFGLYSRSDINKALIYDEMGQKEAVDSIYALLLADEEVKRDTMAQELILRDYYNSTLDLRYLDQASQLIAPVPTMDQTRAIHTIAYFNYYMRNADYARADSILPQAMREYRLSQDMGMRIDFCHLYSQLLEHQGKPDSALHYLKTYVVLLDTLRQAMSEEEVMRLQSQREIQQQRSEHEAKALSERVKWIILSLMIIIIAIIIGWLLHKRNLIDKIKKAQAELELEKNQRFLAAKLLAVEEKDKLLTTVKKTMHDISQQPETASDSVRELESMIKFHALGQEEWQNFATLFEKVNPAFIRNIKARCPGIAENYIKLASYIYSGMSNAQIARLLMIRPESVHQSRWRLRRLLSIPKDTTLEEGLRQLADLGTRD